MKQELPKSAQQVLARQPVPDEHPSADLLAGFAEQNLPAAEKQRVNLHLAACAECREVVFLAAAAAPAEQHSISAQPEAVPRRHVWANWKWLAPALAAVVVVAIVIVNRPQTRTTPPVANSSVAIRPPSTPSQLEANNAAGAPAMPSGMEANNTVRKSLMPTAPAPSVSYSEPKAAPARKAKSEQRPALQPRAMPPPTELDKLANNRAAKPLPPRTTAEVRSAVPPVAPPESAAPVSGAVMQSAEVARPAAKAAAPPTSSIAAAPPTVSLAQNEAKDSSGAGVRDGAPGAVGGILGSAMSKRAGAFAAPPPRWRITADGQLERSVTPGAWTRVLAEQPVIFRTVAVVGSDVWAGGGNGALFHSVDGGNQWSQVQLVAGGQTERGTVTSIRFDTPSQGRVTTEEGTAWSTLDGGKTWAKQ